MVPLSVGSQTNGSVIRPAAFCGVYGFKPTHGLISRHGILKLSRTLDQVGFFARALEDIALLAEQLVGHDESDPDTRPRARIPFVRTAAEEPPLTPLLAFVKTPVWDRATEETRDAFAELTETLGVQCEEYELPESLRAAWDWQRTIMEAEMALNLDIEWEKGRDRLSEPLRALLSRGREARAIDYQKALARLPVLHEGFEELFARYDAVLTPSAPGTAPEGLHSTGDPAFCTLWTLCGMPALNLPLMRGGNGLPLGVQLVGARHGDARLLRTARWLVSRVQAE
jgi:Asp-tRNA(Asn)/Glu-tRNA(Gln) amidotransferase A subunit family amidase